MPPAVHMPTPHPQLSTLGPPSATLGQLGLQEHTDFRSPLVLPPLPPAVTSVFGKPFLKDHQNFQDWLRPPRKTQGQHLALPQRSLCNSAVLRPG